MNKLMRLMTIGALGLQLSWGVPAAGEKAPGDEFRETALDYERQAYDAIGQAIQSHPEEAGRYLQLAVIHRWMADIKRQAAVLADQDRWDEMVWDEYQELEAQRDRLTEELHDSQAIEPQAGDPGDNFLAAAWDYEAQANEARQQAEISDGIERVIFEELTGIFEAMAQIKYQASVAHRSDTSFDWTEYEELARKRDDLLALIEHAQ